MSDIEISLDVFNKYHTNGKLRLSAGYFQEVLEAEGYPGHDGIVQFLKGKEECGVTHGRDFIHRVRVSDGVFLYNLLLSSDLKDQLDAEVNKLAEGSIIALTSLEHFPEEGAKPTLLVTGYRLLSRNHPILNAPNNKAKSHPGNKAEHAGFRSTFILEDDWQEVANFCGDFQENMANPPAAKVPKREAQEDAPRLRAPAPEPPRSRAAPPPARRGPSKTENGILPIAMVTPYVNNFKIHGMISRKEEIRTFPQKNTKVFNFEITDSNGDTIRCVAFNDAAESFYTTVTENLSYYVSGGSVRQANKKFNNTGHDYEINLSNQSNVEPGGELLAAPKLNLKRIPLSGIAANCGELIDVLVVVENIDADPTHFISRAGKEFVKRELELIDESQVIVKLTMWGDDALKASSDEYYQKVIAFKGVSVKEFGGGYSLSTGASTRIVSVPDIEGVAELYDWYHNDKPLISDVKMLSTTTGGSSEAPRTIAGLQEMQFGKDSDKGDYVSVKAMITRINAEKALYKGCASENCQKKVSDVEGEYRCEKCNKSMNKFKWLYMMQFELSDETGQVYVTAFGDNAVKVIGKTAAEMGELKDENLEAYNAVFEKLQFVPKMWRLRCKMENYNEETRQKMTVYGMDDVPQDKYIENLKQLIEQMKGIGGEGDY